jgi:anti-sigma regulatory factor (Ser/Thr protein kinase)
VRQRASELALTRAPDAARRARKLVVDTLGSDDDPDAVHSAELAVTELVTNALLHGQPPVVVRVVLGDARVRVEVADGSPNLPVRAVPSADAMTGRGLALVEAVSIDWGAEPVADGKVVWAEIPCPSLSGGTSTEATGAVGSPHAVPTRPGATPTEGGTRDVTVRLGDVPTDLLLAAKAHVENLVREFTLAASGAASGKSAAVPPKLAELIEDVVHGWSSARLAIKRQALDAAAHGRERTSLTLRLPPSAVVAGERYLDALDGADEYARRAELLTLATPREHKVFRRWYTEAIITQLRAAAAGRPGPPTQPFEERWREAQEHCAQS